MVGVSQKTHNGFTIRVFEYYDGKNDESVMRLDVLFGWAATIPSCPPKSTPSRGDDMAVTLYKAYQGYAAGATIIVPDDTQTALIAQGIGYAHRASRRRPIKRLDPQF